MRPFETMAHVGPDGTLNIKAPELANRNVHVRVEEVERTEARTSWKEFLRKTSGSIPDFPDIERAGPEGFRPMEPLD
jgi:hypothetical protein